jgi:GGDEF domain-containing protein
MRISIAGHQAEIHDLAFRDRLTGLPNRPAFRNALKALIDRGGPAAPVAVLMFGLDRFKHVNDVLGYAFGDRLLQAVAGRVSGDAVRGNDLIARLGSDEFAVLLPGSDPARAEEWPRAWPPRWSNRWCWTTRPWTCRPPSASPAGRSTPAMPTRC